MATKERNKAAARREIRKARGPHASLKWLRVSPRKARLVVDMVRGKDVEEALNLLTFSPKAVSEPLGKLIRSAVANADVAGDYDLDKLYLKTAVVDEGPTWRRWLPRAMGRATRIRKRTSHISVELAERQ